MDSSKSRNVKNICITSDGESWMVPLKSVFIFLCASIITAIAVEVFSTSTTFINLIKLNVNTTDGVILHDAPTFAIYGNSKTEDHLVHVLSVLNRMGYERVAVDKEWDLLWAHDYPYFKMPTKLKNLKPHQMVNHFPGCGFITNKVDLSTAQLPFMPRAFRLPADKESFLKYSKSDENMLFVVKHNEHRHIVIESPETINLDSNSSFVQEYIQNPFLIDGYKFDIGVYVLITSVDPLRVYLYTGDVLFRYCPVKYYPFDAKNVDKYVVGDDYLPTWEVPSLTKYYLKFGGSMRGVFEAYVRDQELDPSGIWEQVEDIIRRTVLAKELDIARILRAYKTRNFFDLLRFDFIIDNNLRVYLIEANMSPNLSSAHFKQNAILYEQILYSSLNLLGIGSPLKSDLIPNNEDDNLVIAEKNLATDLNMCSKFNCDKSCNRKECNLCLSCVSGSEYNILKSAHREHLHRIDMKRIFPKPIMNFKNYNVEWETRNMTGRNAWMSQWFHGKCQYDFSWCS